MRKYLIILLLVFASGYGVKAQFLDSIQASLNRKGKFAFEFNSRNSFIGNSDAYIWGFLVGVRFDRRISIGGGYNVLSTYLTQSEIIEGRKINKQINFSFISYYVQYIFRITKHWELDINLAAGAGSSYFTYTYSGAPITNDQRFVMPVEPSLELDYDFNRYFGLFVQVGYRWMMINNNALNVNFNSPTYDFGLLIYPLEIYAGLFPKTKLAHIIED